MKGNRAGCPFLFTQFHYLRFMHSLYFTPEPKEDVIQVKQDLGNGRYIIKTFVNGKLKYEFRNWCMTKEEVLQNYKDFIS